MMIEQLIQLFIHLPLLLQIAVIHCSGFVLGIILAFVIFAWQLFIDGAEYRPTTKDRIKERRDLLKTNLSRSVFWELTVLIIIFGWALPYIIHVFINKFKHARKNWLDKFWPYKVIESDKDDGPYR